ncbi:MAG: protein kinase [Myxococcota bacterium]|nr:protein kinase [Myxococcota bacterium]
MKKPSVFGKYLLLERINVGGMAEVFIAKAFGVEGFERILAIKKILPSMAEDEEFITMFIDEARISVQLNHANIVHIHELGKYDETYFIAMEYVAGRDIRTVLELYRKRQERMPVAQAVYLASKMCEGLDYAHRKKDARGQDLNIIHRDISPQNILCSYEGEVKLIDFGIAKAANRSQKTKAGILKGKFGYMSPEQVRGLPIDRRSDIFAVGVILYEMLIGEKLFVGESDFSTLEKVRNAEVPPLQELNSDIPEALEEVIRKALAREVEDRYQWPSDLQEDLMRFLLAGEALYSGKHLSAFMKGAFAEELRREAERMERFASIERPDQLESSSVRPTPQPPKPRRSLPQMQAVAMPASRPPATSPPPQAEDPTGAGPDPRDRTQIVSGAMLADPGGEPDDYAAQEEPKTTIEHSPPSAAAAARPPVRTPSGRAPVVIGEPGGYSGATVVGERPVAPDDATGPIRPPARAGLEDDDEDQATATGRPARGAPNLREEERTGPARPSARGFVPSGESAEHTGPARGSPFADHDDSATAAELVPPPSLRPNPPLKAPAPLQKVTGGERATPRGLGLAMAAAVILVLGVGSYLLFLRSTPGLRVEVNPRQGARVQLEDRRLPVNEVTPLPPGDYEVQVSAPGHVTARRRVTVEDAEVVLRVTLEPEPAARAGEGTPDEPPAPAVTGTETAAAPASAVPAPQTFVARFQTSEEGVEILVNGQPVGVTPNVRAVDLPIAKVHRYSARRAGFRTVEGEIRSGGEPEVLVAIPLEREAPKKPREVARREEPKPRKQQAVGRLAASSNPAGAEIFVDGKATGRRTPVPKTNALELAAGQHRIVFKLEGKQSAPQTITIAENETFTLRNVLVQ